MLSDTNLEQQPQQRLRELRPLLLSLHKALMEHERTTYEQTHGVIATRGEYFQLVLGHEWFNWLRPISQMIVRIDEQLNAKKPDEAEPAETLLAAAQALLTPSPDETSAQYRYDQAIQHSPEIAFMHAQLSQIFGKP